MESKKIVYLNFEMLILSMSERPITEKLSSLVKEGNRLKGELQAIGSNFLYWNTAHYQECVRWKGACVNLLKLRFGINSEYLRNFQAEINNVLDLGGGKFYQENIAQATGVLEYVFDAIISGLTEDLFYKREVLVFKDLLDQAFEFLEKELMLAAAIYGRIVLETTMREFAKKDGIEEKNFDQVLISLRKKGVIQKPFESSLRANYQLGSLAAHGDKDFQNYSKEGIREYLSFIRDRVLTL